MALTDSSDLSLWEVGEEGEVVCVRYWVALGILSVLTSFVFFADLIFVLNNPKFSLWKK